MSDIRLWLEVARQAKILRDMGYDGPFMGEEIQYLFDAILKAEMSGRLVPLIEKNRENYPEVAALVDAAVKAHPNDYTCIAAALMRGEYSFVVNAAAAIANLVQQVAKSALAEDRTCMGTLCAMCKLKPADSHDGCRLRAAEAEVESLGHDLDRVHSARKQAAGWQRETEDILKDTRRRMLELEKAHQEEELEFAKIVNPEAGEVTDFWQKRARELQATNDRLRARCEALEERLLDYRTIAPLGPPGGFPKKPFATAAWYQKAVELEGDANVEAGSPDLYAEEPRRLRPAKNGCTCSCHTRPGIVHCVPCC